MVVQRRDFTFMLGRANDRSLLVGVKEDGVNPTGHNMPASGQFDVGHFCLSAVIVNRPVVPLHAGCQVDILDGPIGTGRTPGQAENQCDIIAGGVAQ
jgi:hypothetical protein